MERLFNWFEKYVTAILLVFGMAVVVFQVVQLIWTTVVSFDQRFKEAGIEYAPEYTRTIGVLFFNILLMMEILQTLKIFSHTNVTKARVILIVCLIAVSRKILALGEKTENPMAELSLAGLILALSAGYFLVSRFSKDPVEDKK